MTFPIADYNDYKIARDAMRGKRLQEMIDSHDCHLTIHGEDGCDCIAWREELDDEY